MSILEEEVFNFVLFSFFSSCFSLCWAPFFLSTRQMDGSGVPTRMINEIHITRLQWAEKRTLCWDVWTNEGIALQKGNVTFSPFVFAFLFYPFCPFQTVLAGLCRDPQRPLAVLGKLLWNCSVPSDKLLIIKLKSSYSFEILGSYWSYFEAIYGEISTNTVPLKSLGSVRCKDALNWSEVTLRIFMMLQKIVFKINKFFF